MWHRRLQADPSSAMTTCRGSFVPRKGAKIVSHRSAPQASNPVPVRPSERIQFLDLLRGVAIFAILPVNITFMGLTEASSGFPAGGSSADQVGYFLTETLFLYKPVTLFSLLFGAGIVMIWRKPGTTHEGYLWIMRRRFFTLWVFGVAHATLLWYGDVLTYYAPIGLGILLIITCSARTLWRAGLVITLVPPAMMVVLMVASAADVWWAESTIHFFWSPKQPYLEVGSATGTWSEFWLGLRNWHPDFEEAVFRDASFVRITIYRTTTWLWGFVQWGSYIGWRIVGVFIIGMAWTKQGWLLRPASHRDRFRRFLTWGLVVGVPLTAACGYFEATANMDAVRQSAAELCQYVGSLALSGAIVGAIALMSLSPRTLRFVGPFLAPVGRTAISNYVLQSLVCNLLFYSYGFALFGSMNRLELLTVTVGVWVLHIVLSNIWMHYYRFGPLEWLWRAVSYWKTPPLKRASRV